MFLDRNLVNAFFISEQSKKLGEIARRARHNLSQLNLFKEEYAKSRRENAQQVALLSTRIYIVLLLTIMFILTLFNGLTTINVTETVSISSIDQVQVLHAEYSTTVSCPCQQIAIPSGFFLSVTPQYHQVQQSKHFIESWIMTTLIS